MTIEERVAELEKAAQPLIFNSTIHIVITCSILRLLFNITTWMIYNIKLFF